MANALRTDITGRFVVIKEAVMSDGYKELHHRVVEARGGFGCLPDTSGGAVFAASVLDGSEFRIEGFQLERFATDDEVAITYAANVAAKDTAAEMERTAANVARSLDNPALAERLAMIAADVRTFPPVEREAFLAEAATRIRNTKS